MLGFKVTKGSRRIQNTIYFPILNKLTSIFDHLLFTFHRVHFIQPDHIELFLVLNCKKSSRLAHIGTDDLLGGYKQHTSCASGKISQVTTLYTLLCVYSFVEVGTLLLALIVDVH